MAKIAGKTSAARKRSPRDKKTAHKKKSTTVRASKKVEARPPEQLTVPPAEQSTCEDIAAIATAICNALDDAVELIACLPALKGVAQVIDDCACPPDPAKNPPDWCLIVTAQVQRELEYAIRCVNHAIHRKLQQVTIIMGLDPCKLPHTSSCD